MTCLYTNPAANTFICELLNIKEFSSSESQTMLFYTSANICKKNCLIHMTIDLYDEKLWKVTHF